jgi:predicted RNA binding protein YcfA (HicA-like mRNA interferase family)
MKWPEQSPPASFGVAPRLFWHTRRFGKVIANGCPEEMPKKIRELKSMLRQAGWNLIPGGGKGSHSKWGHEQVKYRMTLSGKDGDDAGRYQERDVRNAVRDAKGE